MIYLLRPWAILLQMSPTFLANPGFFHANYASFYPISRSGIAFRAKTHLLADEGPRKNMDLRLVRGYF